MIIVVPLAIAVLVLLGMPSGMGSTVPHSNSSTFTRMHPRLGIEESTERYAVVIDAGSTGTRVHSYRFLSQTGGALVLLNDDFHSIKPGLSAYAEDPRAAADSLDRLLAHARDAVPLEMQSETPIELRATAGLR